MISIITIIIRYYYNVETGAVQWEHPGPDALVTAVSLGTGMLQAPCDAVAIPRDLSIPIPAPSALTFDRDEQLSRVSIAFQVHRPAEPVFLGMV